MTISSVSVSQLCLLCILMSLVIAAETRADTALRLAVAANFKPVLQRLVDDYEAQSHEQVDVSTGSTGALYAQITQGAPFDVFFAADANRPAMLEAAELTSHRQAYALGQLVFWKPDASTVTAGTLRDTQTRIAIANPRHAPYGQAAMQVLSQVGPTNPDLVFGSNVAQAFTFVLTGNVDAGLVALSQVKLTQRPETEYWLIPATAHAPIEQHLVVLKRANRRADDFMTYLNSDAVKQTISEAGYLVPGQDR